MCLLVKTLSGRKVQVKSRQVGTREGMRQKGERPAWRPCSPDVFAGGGDKVTRSESESQVGQPQKEPLRHLEVRQQNPLPEPCSESGLQRPPGNTLAPAGCTTVPAILQEGDPAAVIPCEFPLGSPAPLWVPIYSWAAES